VAVVDVGGIVLASTTLDMVAGPTQFDLTVPADGTTYDGLLPRSYAPPRELHHLVLTAHTPERSLGCPAQCTAT